MLDDLGFEYLYERNVQTCSRAHLISYSVDFRGYFARVKRPKCEPNHSPPTRAKVKNKCSSPLHAFMVCIGLTLPFAFLSLTYRQLFKLLFCIHKCELTPTRGRAAIHIAFLHLLKATSSPNNRVQCFVLSCQTIILSV